MAVRALDPAAWGFPTRCYVCDPSNDRGLRLPFTYDDEAGVVGAEFTFGPEYSGAPRFVHGGVVLAVLDEAMAWAAIASAGRFAVVETTSTTFERGVEVGRPHRVEAEVRTQSAASLEASARVVDGEGRRCAQARASLIVLSERSARRAIGEVAGDDIRYLRKGEP